MRLTVSNYSFEAIPLEGTLAIARSMGFKGVDIGGFHARGKASLEPEQVAASPQQAADDLKRLLDKYELDAVDYFPQFGRSPAEQALTDLDPRVPEHNIKLIEGLAKFCKLAGIPGMTVLPGIDEPSRSLEQNLDLAARGLQRYAEVAGEHDVAIRFEAHMGAVADTPERALAVLERAPAVSVTLDYAHFVLQYIGMERAHKLIPRTGHVHIRPARPGKLQTRYAENTIDFVDVIQRLRAVGYRHSLSVEFVCSEWYDANAVDTLSETMIVKEALQSHLTL